MTYSWYIVIAIVLSVAILINETGLQDLVA